MPLMPLLHQAHKLAGYLCATCPRRFRVPMKNFLNSELQMEGPGGRKVVKALTEKENKGMTHTFEVRPHKGHPRPLLLLMKAARLLI